MPLEIEPTNTPSRDAFAQYVRDLEPLVVDKAPQLRPPDVSRVLLGRVADLAPGRPESAAQLADTDSVWLRALGEVTHRHGVSYELVTHEDGEDHLWLVPLH
jgi:hypothetical protein